MDYYCMIKPIIKCQFKLIYNYFFSSTKKLAKIKKIKHSSKMVEPVSKKRKESKSHSSKKIKIK